MKAEKGDFAEKSTISFRRFKIIEKLMQKTRRDRYYCFKR